MKKYLLLLLLTACTTPTIEETVVDENLFEPIRDEWMTVPLEAVPFRVELPAGWTFREEEFLYTLSFDEGASGYIQIAKTPKEKPLGYEVFASGMEMACKDEKYCYVLWEDLAYSVVLVDKNMNATQRSEALEILGRIYPDQ